MIRTRTRPVLAGLLVLVVLLTGASLFGYRANLRTGRVAVPAASATPEEVALAYMTAYNDRDRATMTAIFPSRSVPRFRALGRYDDITVVSAHPMSATERAGGVGEHHPEAAIVQVTLTFTGFDRDLAYTPGANGWNYYLVRDRPTDRWLIADQGVL